MSHLVYTARTRAGRAWIETILASATRVDKVEIDNLTDERVHTGHVDLELVRRFLEIDGRSAELIQLDPRRFVYFFGFSGRLCTKYVITTYAFDVSDLPEMTSGPRVARGSDGVGGGDPQTDKG